MGEVKLQKRLLVGVAILGLFLVVLLFICPFAYAEDSANGKSGFIPLPASPSPGGLYLTLIAIAIFIMLIVVYMAVRARATIWRHRKTIGIAALIIMAVVAGAATLWSTEPSIQYGVTAADSYQRGSSDNSLTINNENNGYWAATFDLVLQLTNGNISAKTTTPHQQLDSATAKFTFTLQAGEKQSIPVYFSIKDNVTDFYISWTFQPSSFFMKSDSLGLPQRSYQREQNSDMLLLRMPAPPA